MKTKYIYFHLFVAILNESFARGDGWKFWSKNHNDEFDEKTVFPENENNRPKQLTNSDKFSADTKKSYNNLRLRDGYFKGLELAVVLMNFVTLYAQYLLPLGEKNINPNIMNFRTLKDITDIKDPAPVFSVLKEPLKVITNAYADVIEHRDTPYMTKVKKDLVKGLLLGDAFITELLLFKNSLSALVLKKFEPNRKDFTSENIRVLIVNFLVKLESYLINHFMRVQLESELDGPVELAKWDTNVNAMHKYLKFNRNIKMKAWHVFPEKFQLPTSPILQMDLFFHLFNHPLEVAFLTETANYDSELAKEIINSDPSVLSRESRIYENTVGVHIMHIRRQSCLQVEISLEDSVCYAETFIKSVNDCIFNEPLKLDFASLRKIKLFERCSCESTYFYKLYQIKGEALLLLESIVQTYENNVANRKRNIKKKLKVILYRQKIAFNLLSEKETNYLLNLTADDTEPFVQCLMDESSKLTAIQKIRTIISSS